MRVAFTLIGGTGWTGGVNYLENLLSAISEQHDCEICPVLFAGTDSDPNVLDRLTPYLVEPPILSVVWNNSIWMRTARFFCGFCLQRDYFSRRIFKRSDIDVVFQHSAWYGCRFGIPTLAWIADFQHRRLPAMFNRINFYWRDIGYWALSHCATRLMVSSLDSKLDCEKYYPRSIGRVTAVPFSVRVGPQLSSDELLHIRTIYRLPEKFFYLPNQFWKHKNHLRLIEALHLIQQSGSDVVIVASGNPKDGRNPGHPQNVFDLVKNLGLEGKFIFLGLIPFQHIMPLMRLSAAVVNPSLFEGWSTTVEEAKAVGAPMVLSDLPIHREQTDHFTAFFDPYSAVNIADMLSLEWSKLKPGPRPKAEEVALQKNNRQRILFAEAFSSLVAQTFMMR